MGSFMDCPLAVADAMAHSMEHGGSRYLHRMQCLIKPRLKKLLPQTIPPATPRLDDCLRMEKKGPLILTPKALCTLNIK
jgi:hypothetical protein